MSHHFASLLAISQIKFVLATLESCRPESGGFGLPIGQIVTLPLTLHLRVPGEAISSLTRWVAGEGRSDEDQGWGDGAGRQQGGQGRLPVINSLCRRVVVVSIPRGGSSGCSDESGDGGLCVQQEDVAVLLGGGAAYW